MKTHDLVQGSDAWKQFRLEHYGASEAAAMLGLSKTVRRTDLLHAKHTGNPKEFSDWLQKNVLDYGHEVEAKARPHVEVIVGDDLYPVTCSEGLLSASCDGLTMDDSTAFEHKQWNDEIAKLVAAGEMPEEHMPQCQQIMLVTGAERVFFVVSDGTPEKMVYLIVRPDQAWFDRIGAGWIQFEKDLADYAPLNIPDKPTGKAPETLPALRIEISGQVTASNLSEFKQTALTAIRSVNRDLKTDEDFANAFEAVKWCETVESKLAAAKEHALSQTVSIDALFKTIDEISAEARTVRLELDKLVTKRKTEIKDAIVIKARLAYEMHIAALKSETGGIWYALAQPDFAGATKAKRTVQSLQDAVDTTLANAKIEADAMARTIRAAAAFLDAESKGYEFLFADRHALLQKPIDDLKLAITSRIAAHKLAEADKERAKAAVAQPVAPAAAAAVRFVPIAPSSVKRPSSESPVMTTGAVCDRLGFTLKTDFIAETLGVVPAPTPKGKSGTYWFEADFDVICFALVTHVQRVAHPAGVTA